MAINTSRQLKLGSFLSYAQMILSIVISLIYHPFMIRLLGKSEYGLYSTVSSIIALLGVLNLGFNAGYIRYYAKYKKNGETENVYKLNGLFMIIFTIIPLMGLCTFYFNRKLKKAYHLNKQRVAEINARIEDNLSGIRVVKSFANEKNEMKKITLTDAKAPSLTEETKLYFCPSLRSEILL